MLCVVLKYYHFNRNITLCALKSERIFNAKEEEANAQPEKRKKGKKQNEWIEFSWHQYHILGGIGEHVRIVVTLTCC